MGKQKQRPPLSGPQLEIMNVVWARGEATVSDVWKALSRRRPVARNTVQTVMTRLEEKGRLNPRRSGKSSQHLEPVVGQEQGKWKVSFLRFAQ